MEHEKQAKINDIRISFENDNILPELNAETLEALGKKSKPVLLKKSVLDRNQSKHPEIGRDEYDHLLGQALYNDPSHFPGHRDSYVNLVTQIDGERNFLVLLEMSERKSSFEIVHMMKINDNNLRRMKKRS
jgi:hypothetical protein